MKPRPVNSLGRGFPFVSGPPTRSAPGSVRSPSSRGRSGRSGRPGSCGRCRPPSCGCSRRLLRPPLLGIRCAVQDIDRARQGWARLVAVRFCGSVVGADGREDGAEEFFVGQDCRVGAAHSADGGQELGVGGLVDVFVLAVAGRGEAARGAQGEGHAERGAAARTPRLRPPVTVPRRRPGPARSAGWPGGAGPACRRSGGPRPRPRPCRRAPCRRRRPGPSGPRAPRGRRR